MRMRTIPDDIFPLFFVQFCTFYNFWVDVLLLLKWQLNATYFPWLFTPHRLLILYRKMFYLVWTVLAIVFYHVYLPVQQFGNLCDNSKLLFHNKFSWIGITTTSVTVICYIYFQINFSYIYGKSLQNSFQPNKPNSVGDLINKILLMSAWEHLEQRSTWKSFFFFLQRWAW